MQVGQLWDTIEHHKETEIKPKKKKKKELNK